MSKDSVPPPNLVDYDREYAAFSWDDVPSEFSFYKNSKVNYAFEVTDYQVSKGRGGMPAFITQKPDGELNTITFRILADASNKLAAGLQKRGLTPGDRLGIYAPKSIEYAIVLFAALKCGAIVVPLFEAFGTEAITDRLSDSTATWLYTTVHLRKNVDFAHLPLLTHLLVPEHAEKTPSTHTYVIKELMAETLPPPNIFFGDLETPFIIHYTSGSTGKPKGILLANRAMLGHLITARYVLDLHESDQYWNTGDPGWVTGMVYNFFAPLLHGIAAHLYEGPFQADAWMDFLSSRKISVWYSTPTAFRLLRYYDIPLSRKNVPALRHIVSAGEPLNPSLIDWTMEAVGIPIHDSWFMTENGHQLINNYRALPIRKGSMGKPLPGIIVAILDEEGGEVSADTVGRLAVKTPWPGLMKAVWNNQKKFDSYFEHGWYISGDTAYVDSDGYFWFQGREDDLIKTASERVSPFEIESALLAHPAVAEAGVVGKPHDLYGSIIKAFVIIKMGIVADPRLAGELMQHVRVTLSAHEVPREIEFVTVLPKTKSGKIMRRILRAREAGENTGDLSTLDIEMNPKRS